MIPEKNTKYIETYQLAISVMIVVGMMFGTWLNVTSRLSILETKQETMDQFRIEIRNSLKDLSTGQTEILIKLENKKNR